MFICSVYMLLGSAEGKVMGLGVIAVAFEELSCRTQDVRFVIGESGGNLGHMLRGIG